MPSMPAPAARSQASRKTATQLRAELNRLREAGDRSSWGIEFCSALLGCPRKLVKG